MKLPFSKSDGLPKIKREYPTLKVKRMSLEELEKALSKCETEYEAVMAKREAANNGTGEPLDQMGHIYMSQLSMTQIEDMSALRHAITDKKIAARKKHRKEVKKALRWKR